MNKESKLKKIILLLLRLACIAGGAWLCIPLTRFFNDIIGEGETSLRSMTGSFVCTCLIALLVLAVVAGVRALAGRPFKLTVGLICLVILACLTSGWIFYSNSVVVPTEETGISTPRPTVTPPPVEINEKTEYNQNPESGTVIYKKYADNAVRLLIDNASSQDMYVKMRDKNAVTVLEFYIRGNDTVPVYVPVGTYEFVFALGKNWIDTDQYFGENTKFKRSKEYRVFYIYEEYEISFSKSLTELLEVSRREFEK